MTKQPIIMAVLIAGFIAGCSGVSDNFPRLVNSPPSAARASIPQSIPIPTSGIVDVAPGDTVYSIARRYGVAMRDVIDANRLKAPFVLEIGQSLRLPPPRLYVVSPGDTIFSISQRFGVDMRTLVSMNGLAAPYQVSAGQALKMPVRGAAKPTARAPAAVTGLIPLPPFPCRRRGQALWDRQLSARQANARRSNRLNVAANGSFGRFAGESYRILGHAPAVCIMTESTLRRRKARRSAPPKMAWSLMPARNCVALVICC
ncbi:MAG: LysM peptidoglycan-binding domain-containing protein [Proteobacteria bacterium]|nr:LysM peptidoglycan-binding domain-containing protein [Pseudomonadota bacterium]